MLIGIYSIEGVIMKINSIKRLLSFVFACVMLVSAVVFSSTAEEKSFTLDKTVYRPVEKLTLSVSGATGLDWVGVYAKDVLPGTGSPSLLWGYVGDKSEEYIYINKKLGKGEYTAYLLENDGYNVLDSVDFSIVEPTLSIERTSYSIGMPVTFTHTDAEGKDWIGLYAKGSTPKDGNPALLWSYVGDDGSTVMNLNNKFTTGEYTAYLCFNDGYSELDSCDFTVVEKQIVTPKDPISVEFIPSDEARYGFSEGTVKVSVGDLDCDGALLYWGDENGVLSDYTYFGYAPYRSTEGKCVYEVTKGNLIPEKATAIYAYAVCGTHFNVLKRNAKYSENGVYTEISVPTRKLGEPIYSFEVISDLHVTAPDDYKGTGFDGRFNNDRVISAFTDITRNSKDSSGVMVVGDLTNYGKDEEYAVLGDMVSEYIPDIPISYTIGNHAFYSRGEAAGFEESWVAFRKYAGWSDEDGYYRYFKMNGDYFIFLGTEGYLEGADTAWGYFSETQREWLRSLLAEAALTDANAFVFMHQSIENTVSGSFKTRGQWWDGINDDELMKDVIESYENTFLFTGHSHWNLNSYGPFINGGDTGASYYNTASAGYLWCDDDVGIPGSEGLHVEVYPDAVVVKGRDFEQQKWIPNVNTYVKKRVGNDLGITSTDYNENSSERSTEFTVPGVQIRTSGKQGLRFVAYVGNDILEKYASLNSENKTSLTREDTDIGYGFVVIPKEYLGDTALSKDTVLAKTVPAEKIFEKTDEYTAYTVVITDIAISNYKRNYTVVPYITYKDENGDKHTFYGKEYSANVYDTVLSGIENETDADAISTLEEVVKAYDEFLK